jgi:hypothetical protein
MIRNFRLNSLFKRLVNTISDNKHKDYKDWVNKYNKLSDNFKENLIVSIYKFQSKDARELCKNKEEVYLMNIGVFKIKTGRKLALDIRSELSKEKDNCAFTELSEEDKKEVLEKTELTKRIKLKEYREASNAVKDGNITKVLYLKELKAVKKI